MMDRERERAVRLSRCQAKTSEPNPKDLIGVKKPPTLSVIPTTALFHMGLAMQNGAEKYGAFNWRQHPVKASIYVDAIMRHLAAWFDSEEEAEDSGVHHLGHVAACCAILMDAQAMNALLDDRPGEQSGDTPIIGPAPSVIRSLTKR